MSAVARPALPRIFGPIPVENIIGKAWITYWPFSDLGLVPHYDYPQISD